MGLARYLGQMPRVRPAQQTERGFWRLGRQRASDAVMAGMKRTLAAGHASDLAGTG